MRRMVAYNEWANVKKKVEEMGDAATSFVFQKSIPADSWESSRRYSMKLNIPKEININDAVIIGIQETASSAQKEAAINAELSFTMSTNNYLYVDCNGTIPEVSIPLNICVLTPSKIGL